jgi:hypothetical protein
VATHDAAVASRLDDRWAVADGVVRTVAGVA